MQAAAFDPQGRLWDIEHGTNGGDELNRVEKGKNYGWPVQAYGGNLATSRSNGGISDEVPHPKATETDQGTIDVKLEVSLLKNLDRYCQYMESDRDYVIGTVLQVVFKKDKGFAAWVRNNEALRLTENSADRLRA